MPTTLLSLSNDIIHRIGYFLHKDNFVPFPSFNPHWANFASDIDPEVSTDYLNFRSVCKRLKEICTLKGIHVKLSRWGKLLDWVAHGPIAVKEGVRRIHMDVQGRKGRSILSSWIILVNFLASFPSLEELTLVDTPLCRHYDNSPSHDSLHHHQPFLSNLRSLSFEMNCKSCSDDLPLLFCRHTPKLCHLKTVDSPNLLKFLQTMSPNSSASQTIGMSVSHVLCIKLTKGESDTMKTLETVSEVFPQVTDLSISMHESMPPHTFTPAFYICHTPFLAGSGDDMTIGLITEDQARRMMESRVYIAEPNKDELTNLLDILARFCNLHTLECGLFMVPANKVPSQGYPSSNQSFTAMMDAKQRGSRYTEKQAEFWSFVQERLIAKLPGLTHFQFWLSDNGILGSWRYWRQMICRVEDDDVEVYYYLNRWTSSLTGQIATVEESDVSDGLEEEV